MKLLKSSTKTPKCIKIVDAAKVMTNKVIKIGIKKKTLRLTGTW